jgi:hypothetical protein
MSISKTPALCKAAKLVKEVSTAQSPEYNTVTGMVEPDGIEPTT